MDSYFQYNVDYISGVMSLRTPQKKSLEILDNIISSSNLMNNKNIEEIRNLIKEKYPLFKEFERDFVSLTFALATGVGKTRLMGAFIAYLYTNYDIKNILVVAPSTTIYDKLTRDLSDINNPKYVFKGLGCFKNPPKVVFDDDFNRSVTLFDSDITIYVYNISKFDKDNTKMKSFSETLGMSFYDKLAEMKDLVLIMDESHHYRAEKGMETINNLKPLLGLELTATPIVNVKGKQEQFKNVVYEYSLAKAVRDGYTRVPFAVTRTDINFYQFGDEELDKLMINDGIKCHKMIKEKLAYYARTTKKNPVKPFMLIVCKDTDHAEKIEKYIKSDDFEHGYYKYKTIKIDSKQSGALSEANTKLLLDVERFDNPVEIVIHVNMLKEGWDVNNLYTIVPLRTASSKILREQMVGRGLRLPYGERTGNKEIDSVMLTAHDKFKEIIEEAQKGDSIFHKENVIDIEDIEDEKTMSTQLTLTYESNSELNSLINETDENSKNEISNTIESLLVKNVEDYILLNGVDLIDEKSKDNIVSSISEEIKKDEDYGTIYDKNKDPIENWIKENIDKTRDIAINKFILIPRIKTEYDEGEYYFDDFDIDLSVFNHKPINNDILIRNLLDSYDEEKIDGGYINFDAINPSRTLLDEIRKKSEVDYERDNNLLYKLITSLIEHYTKQFGEEGMKNIVMMYKKEITDLLYKQMLKHFVRDEGIIKEEVFVDNQINIPNNYSYKIIKDIFDPYNSERDGKITSVLFDGIKRGVFSTAKFDSEPELVLARQLERETDFVKTWLRPSPSEFDITYNNGKKYEPDFVVETNTMIYLIEVKADNQMEDEEVLAKKERATSYCKLVSQWAFDTNNKQWKYLLIPASKISSNSTFKYLAETFIEK